MVEDQITIKELAVENIQLRQMNMAILKKLEDIKAIVLDWPTSSIGNMTLTKKENDADYNRFLDKPWNDTRPGIYTDLNAPAQPEKVEYTSESNIYPKIGLQTSANKRVDYDVSTTSGGKVAKIKDEPKKV